MCAAVCPFDVLTFHPLADGPGPDIAVAVKCDGCIERMRRGETPACAEVCKVDALVFGELNELMTAGRLRETGAVLAAAGATPTGLPDEVLRWQEGADLRAVYLRDDKIIGAQVAGDIRAAGVYHSLMMQRIPVDRYGRRLVEPGFGMADIVFEALGHGSKSRSAARLHAD